MARIVASAESIECPTCCGSGACRYCGTRKPSNCPACSQQGGCQRCGGTGRLELYASAGRAVGMKGRGHGD